MFPYERIVQWLAGPISIAAGWLAAQIVAHFNVFGTLGIGSSQIAHAIVTAVTFAVGAAVTYAAHHKWLDNLAKWWLQNLPPITGDLAGGTPPQSATKPDVAA